MKKHNVSLISYLNSRPFLYGLQNDQIREEINIILDIPAITALKLASGKADIGLIPVGALTDLKNYRIISDFCIGAAGAVRSVVLASQVPLCEIESVLLDYHSRTSVLLVKVLARFFWNLNFRWENSSGDYENISIREKTAGVVIGDRVFAIEKKYPYIYDLSEEWMKFTRLPFVFAVWVSVSGLNREFNDRFNRAIAFGVQSVEEVGKMEPEKYSGLDLRRYFTENISYLLDERKREGMKLFLELVRKLNQKEDEFH